MKLRDLINGKTVDELKIIAQHDAGIEVEDVAPIICAGVALRKSNYKHENPYHMHLYDFSYEGMTLFYLLINKMKKENISDETLKVFQSTSEPFKQYFRECYSRNKETGEQLHNSLQNKIVAALKPIKEQEDLVKVQETVGDFNNYIDYMIFEYALHHGENKDALREGHYVPGTLEGTVKEKLGTALDLLQRPLGKAFGIISVPNKYLASQKAFYGDKIKE